MLVYLLIFLISGSLAALGGHFWRSGREKFLGFVFLALAVLLPSIVAGCRDFTIGTDTNYYVRRLFVTALSTQDVGQFFSGQIDQYEPGYLLLTFASARVSDDMHLLLFAVETIMLSTMMVAIVKASNGNGLGAAFGAYLILHYNESFNLVRQSLAVAFVMLAVAYLLRKQYVRYALSIFVAISFHSSGIIGLVFLIIQLFVGRSDTLQQRQNLLSTKVSSLCINAALLITPIAFSIAFQPIMELLISWGIVSEKYEIYLTDYSTGITPLLLAVYAISFLMLYLKRKEFDHGRFLVISYAYGVILFLLTGISQHLWRLGTFFNATISLSLAQFQSKARWEAYRTWAAKFVVVGLSLFMWYMQIVVWGNHDTYPYQSALLGL